MVSLSGLLVKQAICKECITSFLTHSPLDVLLLYSSIRSSPPDLIAAVYLLARAHFSHIIPPALRISTVH